MFEEFTVENGKTVPWTKLTAPLLPLDEYKKAHESLIIVCHDVFVEMDGKNLLVVRDNHPAKGSLWPLGGRMKRGISAKESLANIVKAEAGIDITDLKFIGVDRTIFDTDPFGHGEGTDSVNLVYFAKGTGEIVLDSLHSKPTLLGESEYKLLRKSIHPYVVKYLDIFFS